MVDTNVLIYDTYEDSIHHAEASQLLDLLEEWVIPLIVVYEYVWFLRGMGVDSSTALDKLEDYASSGKGRIYREDDRIIRRALSNLSEALSRFNDEVVIGIAAEEGLPLATFDRRMRSRAEEVGVETIPERLSGRR